MLRLKNLLRHGISLTAAIAVMAATLGWSGAPAFALDAPPAPTNLTTSPTPITSDGNVQLNWLAPAGATIDHYQVFRYTGTASPAASAVTYINRTTGNQITYSDTIPTEGYYWYSVMAVDAQGRASGPSNWAFVLANFPANGDTIAPDNQAPAQQANLKFLTGAGAITGPLYSNTELVTLTWPGTTESDLWRYIVYRQKGTAAADAIGYAYPQPGAAALTFVDDEFEVDAQYTYWVVAQDRTGNVSADSNKPVAFVDTTAPVVQITAPVNGQSYTASGTLTITATITDATAGYESTAVKYYLNNSLLTTPTLNLSSLAGGVHTVRVEVPDRAGNLGSATAIFVVNSNATNPTAPRNLTGPAHSNSRTVTLTWQAPQTGTYTNYRVYRATLNQNPVSVGAPTVTQFTDTVTADGIYNYFVVAENGSAVSPASAIVTVKVDTVAPAITVTAPQQGHVYRNSGTLTPQYTVTDATSGYDASQVKLYLDNTLFTGTSINLAALSLNLSHTFRVDVTDRAGNFAQTSVAFTVSETGADPGDDDDDNPAPEGVLELLASLKSQIHHGHYVAISAQIRSGNIDAAIKHIQKHRGKFITPEAADQLLQALGVGTGTSTGTGSGSSAGTDNNFGTGGGFTSGKGKK